METERRLEGVKGVFRRISEARLRRSEQKLIESHFVVEHTVSLGMKDLLPKEPPEGWESKTPEEKKRWCYQQTAKKFIPGEDSESEMLRGVFIEGNMQDLAGGGSLKGVSEGLGISWRECIDLLREANRRYVNNATEDFLNK